MTTANQASTGKVEGACLCGAVRFSVRMPALFCVHCHCTMCRRAHGAGFVTWFTVAYPQFSLDRGEDRLVRFKSSDHGTRSFCGICGSSLFFESTRHPQQIDIVLANMNASIGLEPQAHIYFDCRADWVAIDDSLPRLGGPSGMEPIES